MISQNENGMVMPVAPMYGGNYGNGCGFGGDWGSWIILFLIFGLFGNNTWSNGGNNQLPWLLSASRNNDNDVQAGFNQAAITGQLSGIQSDINNGFANVQTSLCGGFANVNATVNGAQNAISQQLYANQIADMNQRFTDTLAMSNQMNNLASGLQNCCCENRSGLADIKYTIATENCADRSAVNEGVRDIITAQTASTQRILDQLCQDKIDAKNDEIARLRQEVAMKDLAASQASQNALIQAGFSQEVDQLYNRLNSCPVPSTPVYGKTPIFTCGNTAYGCGCGAA